MAFVREALLRLATGTTVKDLEELRKQVDENAAAISRWTETPKDFLPMKNQDALPLATSDLESSFGAVLIVVNNKLYIRTGTTYVVVGTQT